MSLCSALVPFATARPSRHCRDCPGTLRRSAIPTSRAPYTGAFRGCTSLNSIGPGFSPSCFVHPNTFDRCPALLAAAEAKGFASAIEWSRHHWLAVPLRRFTVLPAIRHVRRSPPSANFPSPAPLPPR